MSCFVVTLPEGQPDFEIRTVKSVHKFVNGEKMYDAHIASMFPRVFIPFIEEDQNAVQTIPVLPSFDTPIIPTPEAEISTMVEPIEEDTTEDATPVIEAVVDSTPEVVPLVKRKAGRPKKNR